MVNCKRYKENMELKNKETISFVDKDIIKTLSTVLPLKEKIQW